jgi:hypothetical protein
VDQLAFECPQQLPPLESTRPELESGDLAFNPSDDVVDAEPEALNMPRPLELVPPVAAAAAAPSVLPSGSIVQPAFQRWSAGWVVAAALALIAATETIWLARIEFIRTTTAPVPAAPVPVVIDSQQPGDQVLIDGRDVGVTPMTLALKSDMRSIRVRTRQNPDANVVLPLSAAALQAASIVDRPVDAAAASALNQVAARERRGGLRVSSAIELQVLEGDRVLGSSADGVVVASAGKHELDFVNTEFGYQSHQVVDIKAGQIVPMKISPPEGRVSINAVPWASVSIDGNAVGETPLGNIALAVGEHQIVFRHPQLGERTQKVIIKANAPTRVSAVFAR